MVNYNNASVQDGYESGGGSGWTDNPTTLYAGSTDYHQAWRYPSLTVPATQTLDNATHTIGNISVEGASMTGLDYRGVVGVATPGAITTATRPSVRDGAGNLTTGAATVTFPTSPGTGSEATDVAVVIQAIVDDAAYTILDDVILVLFEDGSSGANYHTMTGAGATSGTLDVNWTVAGGSILTHIMAYS